MIWALGDGYFIPLSKTFYRELKIIIMKPFFLGVPYSTYDFVSAELTRPNCFSMHAVQLNRTDRCSCVLIRNELDSHFETLIHALNYMHHFHLISQFILRIHSNICIFTCFTTTWIINYILACHQEKLVKDTICCEAAKSHVSYV